MPALLALIAVTAVWGLTFVQVKDGVVVALSALRLPRGAVPDRVRRARRPGRRAGCAHSAGAAGSRASRSASCSRSAMRCRRPVSRGRPSRAQASSPASTSSSRRCSACSSSARTSAARSGSVSRSRSPGWRCSPASAPAVRAATLLVLAGAAAYSLQIALMERYAPRYDPVAFTQAEMLAAFAGFAVVAVALGQVEVPRGWTVWSALLVTGHLRERARLPRPDLGAAADQRLADGDRVRDGARLRGHLRLLARRRPPRRRSAGAAAR